MSVERVLSGTSVCVCVGSGGVGKTTTSAAIAAGMAARGRKVAVVTIDPARRLADALGLEELGNTETRVDPALFQAAGVDPRGGELWATMLDAKATFDDVVARHAPDEAARDRILGNRIYGQISGALAGSQEYMAMERLYELHEEGSYDLLVLDTPPSRNALDFLDAPQRLLGFIEGRSIRLFLRPAGIGARVAGRGMSVVFAVLRRLTGLDLIEDLSEFFAATSGMIGGFRERADRVNRLLAGPSTGFLIVCGPSGAPVDEAGFLREKLIEKDLPLAGTIVNRVHEVPAEADPAEAREQLVAEGASAELTDRILEALADESALAQRDAGNVRELAQRLGSAPLIRVPELEGDVTDLAGLLDLGRHLFGDEC